MKKILNFFLTHGYILMGVGMLMALVGVFVLMEPANRLGMTRTVSMAVATVGFVLYLAGRVCVSLERRVPRREPDEEVQPVEDA